MDADEVEVGGHGAHDGMPARDGRRVQPVGELGHEPPHVGGGAGRDVVPDAHGVRAIDTGFVVGVVDALGREPVEFANEFLRERTRGVRPDGARELHHRRGVARLLLVAGAGGGQDGRLRGRLEDAPDLLLGQLRALDAGRPPHGAHDVEPVEPLPHRRGQGHAADEVGHRRSLRDGAEQGGIVEGDAPVEGHVPARHGAPVVREVVPPVVRLPVRRGIRPLSYGSRVFREMLPRV